MSASDRPLIGRPYRVTGTGPTSDHARSLLAGLGADTTRPGGVVVPLDDAPSPGEDWAASGAMALTGRADGPPRAVAANPAGAVRAAIAAFGALCPQGTDVLPGVGLLGERAAIAGLTRRGPWSCGGSFRALRTVDGWLGLSLARVEDLDLLPALTLDSSVDSWAAVTSWALGQSAAAAVERAQLLGLAAAAVPSSTPDEPAIRFTRGGRRPAERSPTLVIDLTALWAGPLCAHLLGLAGARVIKVESRHRPDGARSGAAAFYDLLHAGHESVVLDFTDERDRDRLRRLVAAADVVLESSRPRALRQLGINAEAAVERGTIWTSITAYGRTGAWANRVGFGDDVAAAAGLLVPDDGDLLPVGDAVADPLTGVHAAAATAAALLGDRGYLVDVSMRATTARTRLDTAPAGDSGTAAAPYSRRANGPAAALGRDTVRVLAEFGID